MKVHIENNWRTQQIDVWLWDRAGKYLILTRFGEDGRLVEEHVEARQSASIPDKPTFSLPVEVFENLIRAAEGHVHAGDATVKHLDDAIQLRDRFLKMVESQWNAEVGSP